MDTDWNNMKIDPVFADKDGLDRHPSDLSPVVTEGGMDLSEQDSAGASLFFLNFQEENRRTRPPSSAPPSSPLLSRAT